MSVLVHTSPGPSRFNQPSTKPHAPTPAAAPTAEMLSPPKRVARTANRSASRIPSGPTANAPTKMNAALAPHSAQAANCCHAGPRVARRKPTSVLNDPNQIMSRQILS